MDASELQWVCAQLTQLKRADLTVTQAALIQALQEFSRELAWQQEITASEIDGNLWTHRSGE